MADGTELDGVLLRGEDGIREIVLNEPERRNPMSPRIMSGLVEACDLLVADEEVAVVILTGAGAAFCAGGDLRHNDENLGHAPAADQRFLSQLYEPFLRILDLPMPTIAAINGPAIGGGLALSLLCDIRLAATDAVLRTAFASIGFSPGMGLTYTLPRHIGLSLASEVLYADRSLTGDQAAAIGLVSRAVPPAELLTEARRLAGDIAGNSVETNRLIKTLLASGYREDLRNQLEREIPAQVATSSSEDYRSRRAAMEVVRRNED